MEFDHLQSHEPKQSLSDIEELDCLISSLLNENEALRIKLKELTATFEHRLDRESRELTIAFEERLEEQLRLGDVAEINALEADLARLEAELERLKDENAHQANAIQELQQANLKLVSESKRKQIEMQQLPAAIEKLKNKIRCGLPTNNS